MPLDLDDAEKAALIELLTEEISGTRYPLAPRIKLLRQILGKLGVGHSRPQPFALPKPPGERSLLLARKKQRR